MPSITVTADKRDRQLQNKKVTFSKLFLEHFKNS